MVKKKIRKIYYVSVILVGLLLIGGYFAFSFFKEKQFQEDFNHMNDLYKQALFATGNTPDTALGLTQEYSKVFETFYYKYKTHKPTDYVNDPRFAYDLNRINELNSEALELVQAEQFSDAHLTLESVRPIWQNIFIRNDVKLLAFYMTDFHDTMEIAVEKADAKDAQGVLEYCGLMKQKWQSVMNIDVDFTGDKLIDYKKLINQEKFNIDKLCEAAETGMTGSLPTLGKKLKQDYITPYLRYA